MPYPLDFHTLKTSFPIEALLEPLGWRAKSRPSSGLLTGPCPIHGGDNPRAFVVWRRHNRWRCFTRCQQGGDVLDLAAVLWHCSLPEAATRLVHRGPWVQASPLDLPARLETPKPFRPFTTRIPLVPDVSFLAQKGITAQTARSLEAGLYTGQGWLRGCVAVRLFDPAGAPLGYAGRVLAPGGRGQPKWRFPPGLPARTLLYNYHRVAESGARVCILVECPWGVMRLHQLGLPALGLMGLGISEPQHRLLRHFSRVVLMLDGDAAGQQAAQTLAMRLKEAVQVAIHPLPAGMDPDDLPDAELREVAAQLVA